MTRTAAAAWALRAHTGHRCLTAPPANHELGGMLSAPCSDHSNVAIEAAAQRGDRLGRQPFRCTEAATEHTQRPQATRVRATRSRTPLPCFVRISQPVVPTQSGVLPCWKLTGCPPANTAVALHAAALAKARVAHRGRRHSAAANFTTLAPASADTPRRCFAPTLVLGVK